MKHWLTTVRHALGIVTKHKDEQVGLFIPNRQFSWIVSTVLLMGFLCFILGYFWGHRRALQRFVAKIEEESFADRINYALYTMNDRDISEFEQEHDEAASEDTNGNEQEEETEGEEGATGEKQASVSTTEETAKTALADTTAATEASRASVQQTEPTTVFVAPLAGFGTLSAATTFAERVKIFDPGIAVQKRSSRTQKGRMVTWYQVTTAEFEKKEELQKITSTIQEKEHIKKIDIIEKRKG